MIPDTSELVSDLVNLSARARFQAIRSIPMPFNEKKTIRLTSFIIMHLCNISHNANFYLNVNLYLSQQEQSELCQSLKDHPRCRLSSTGVSGKNAIFKYRFVIKFHIPKSAAWYFKSNKTPLPVFPQISCQLGISQASFDYMAGHSEGDRQQVWHFCPLLLLVP